MNNDIRIKVEAYVKELTSDDRIEGVFVFGSQASGTAHDYSDVDLYIVHDGYDKFVDFVDYEGLFIQHQWRNIEEYLEKSKKHTRTRPLGHSALVLYDKNGMIVNCLEASKMHTLPKALDKEFVEMMIRTVTSDINGCYGLKTVNKVGCFLELNEIILYIVDLIYDKNKWWQVPKKHLVKDLKLREPLLGELIEKMLLSQNLDWKLEKTEALFNRYRKEA